MAEASKGDTVKVHYTGKLADGTVFDSSEGRDPLEFKLGQQQIIPGVEAAVEGMSPGESTTAEIAADEAYGPHREELVMKVERSKLPDHIDPEVGQRLEVQQQDGRATPVTVTEVADEHVILDANHPLAGEDLTFDIQLVEIAAR